jgi:hypothetical protein
MREDQIVSEALRSRVRLLPNGEVCWLGSDIEQALHEIANAGQVILGFEILEPLSDGRFKACGISAYKIDDDLLTKTWEECVRNSLALSLRDVHDTRRLTGLKPRYDDLWYCVSSVDRIRERKLSHGEYS